MHAAALREVSNPPRELAPADLGRSSSPIVHAAALGRAQIGKHPQQGRLARAVGPDEAHHLAGTHREVDAVEQRHRIEAHGDTLRLDLHHSSSRSR
jgi:hypothetical protein